MSASLITFGMLGALVAGYVVYGRFIAGVVGVDPTRPTPAHTKRDGVDYVPANHWLVLFGHHFSSICAAGPIVGPALAVAYWGWAPSLLWILLGGVLMGAVADFTALVVAVRHGGVSISEVTGQVVSHRARMLFSVFIFIALILVLAVFSVLTAGTFIEAPEIVIPSWGILPVAVLAGVVLNREGDGRGRLASVTVLGLAAIVGLLVLGHEVPVALPELLGLSAQTTWILALLAYCFVASVVPVQYLLQPRDYLSSYVLFVTIGLGLLGIFVVAPQFQGAAFTSFVPAEWPVAGPLWPMMFVTIACGALSGFHSVVSSGTTCKQLDNEAHACRVGYGAMLTESLVATLVVVAVGAGITVSRHAELLRGPGGAIAAFGEGYGTLTRWLFGDYGMTFAVMALNFFILTTLDTATRLGRYLLEELLGWRNRYAATFVVVALAAALALSGQWRVLWPAFGASNQLVGALALLVVSAWLLQNGRPRWPTLIPAILMLATTVAALGWQVWGALTQAKPNLFLAGLGIVLVVLAMAVLREAVPALRRGRRVPVAS
ncbi:MAG: carbon starvation protein A [Vicinamibacteria bacterium]|nr:carbon starvation protein A [Vicinamibacteria bacterium]